jgi:hypothetical protein
MASTTMTSANALTQKLWATEDWTNPGQRVAFGHMFMRGSVFYVEDFLGNTGMARGDNITYDYTNKLVGIPVGEGGTLDGNEEALNLGSFTMAINVTRIGVLNPNDDTIEQQRTLVDFPERTRKLIPQRLRYFGVLSVGWFLSDFVDTERHDMERYESSFCHWSECSGCSLVCPHYLRWQRCKRSISYILQHIHDGLDRLRS